MEGYLLASKSTGILIVSQEFQGDEFFFYSSDISVIFRFKLAEWVARRVFP